jgi:hypothetical protein
VTLRYLSRLRHIGIGRYYIGARITPLVAGVTSVSSTRMADSSASSPSIPLATTSRSARPRADPRQVGTIT